MANWFSEQRQKWIGETVDIFGFISREHIARKFGVSIPQASQDLSEFQRRNPTSLTYDSSAKFYFNGESRLRSLIKGGSAAKKIEVEKATNTLTRNSMVA